MRARNSALCAISTGVLLAGCTGLYSVDDPRTFTLPKDQVPAFLKSVRCELVTYYEANAERKKLYNDTYARDKITPKNLKFFDIDHNSFGAVALDLKVADSVGVTAASFDNRLINPTTTHTETLHVGPTLSADGTYALTWGFAINQGAKLDTGAETSADSEKCYSAAAATKEAMATGTVPEIEQFQRITVNGGLPLAGWLLDNGSQVGTTWLFQRPNTDKEGMAPAQLSFSFAISGTAGFDLKYILTTGAWNPLTPQVGASTKQTSTLTFYINGPSAKTFVSAKTGTVSTLPPKNPDAIPVFVVPKPSPKSSDSKTIEKKLTPDQKKQLQEILPETGGATKRRPPQNVPAIRRPNPGYLLYPPAILPTVPGQ